MENYLRAFSVLQKRYDLKLFYSISIDSTGIKLQGYFDDALHCEVMKLKLDGYLNSIGYINYKYKYITITLTPCSK
jgi:hypothetical protein